jgi:2-amino-4-hydroxy-6-hydroxymethyldihydropteridine diphosphokinase
MNEQFNVVFLSLGSNLGNKNKNLLDAFHSIGNLPGTNLLQSSGIWKTAAWGKTDQDDFLNAAISIETILKPEELLEEIIDIEKKQGRIREERWGPRIIDIDILFYSNQLIHTTSLYVPHPELQNRKFVLAPLNEIAPEFIHPSLHKSISQLLRECSDTTSIEETDKKSLK